MDRTLLDYSALFDGLRCRWDGSRFTGFAEHFNHEGGWPVSGFEMPQWIYMRCPKCHYDWSLAKIDILKFHTARFNEEEACIENTMQI